MKLNLGELSEYTGLSVNTIKEWVEKEDLPYLQKPSGPGTAWLFDSVAVFRFVMGRSGEPSQRDRDRESKSKLLEAEAGIKWMDYGEKRGALVNISDVLVPVFEAASIVKSRIQALPGRLAQKVSAESDPAVNLRTIKAEVDDALSALDVDFTQALKGD